MLIPIKEPVFCSMSPARIEALLAAAGAVRIGVLGDFCLDVYWEIDPSASESSLETGLPTQPVSVQRCTLGGAGNVVNNLLALGCANVRAFGAVGDDPWGLEMLAQLRGGGAETSGMHVVREHWSTLVYIKPHIQKEEQSRFDFGNFNALPEDAAKEWLDEVEAALPQLDVLIVNEQVKQGIHSPYVRHRLAALIKAHPNLCVLADSRHYSEAYIDACLKVNDHEAARLIGIENDPEALVLRDDAIRAAEDLWARSGRSVFVTRGARGMLVRDTAGLHEIPGLQVLGKIDTVGAGDSALAGIALGLAGGAAPAEAAELGGLTASVTIRKLYQTGTASPDEVREAGSEPHYVFHPELAEDPRMAQYHGQTEIEMIRPPQPDFRARVAIFDHDGTISTLREGWEEVMGPVMIRAVLGPHYASADESLYHRVVDRVREYIDMTTGVQTIIQMQGLVEMVREFGCVPEQDILDEVGYKKVYNDALMEMVRGRLAKLERGELDVNDFVIKGSVAFVRTLSAFGIRLYMASGTDQEDVVSEARGLGYADLFDGGIYGSVGNAALDAKKVVLDRILADIGDEAAAEIVTFGDGPVEMRETHRRGGLSIGIASDEARRFSLNDSKRSRLIRAGADIIVPDFSQGDRLMGLIGWPQKT